MTVADCKEATIINGCINDLKRFMCHAKYGNFCITHEKDQFIVDRIFVSKGSSPYLYPLFIAFFDTAIQELHLKLLELGVDVDFDGGK